MCASAQRDSGAAHLHWLEEIPGPGDLSSPAPTTARELILAELLMTEMTGVDIFFALRTSHET
ncbi:hypothetical protein HEP86_00300 [Streptomyces sp. RPA4-5]|uniref:hypothetical protein n=1 Tax=Streptomyces sp. RPA4-5 TaxID=2721245 RepID=UPI00143EA2AC|nr:hypothetical protein [Streptomyces sp. RPA4-5]QIY53233.1 hypothetical protein HEP86_00300 [Streptomyces sp. RPA4-5]